jgi:hypothetical protein
MKKVVTMVKTKVTPIWFVLTVLAALICLILKILCAVICPQAEPHNSLPLICLSVAYLICLGALCFLSGKTTLSSVIVGAVPAFDVLFQLTVILSDFRHASLPLLYWTNGSSYASLALVNHFEDVDECLSDWYYFAAFAAANLLAVGMIFLGRHKLMMKHP